MFKNRTYWLVGASEGLGRALAQALDLQGASLVLSARDADRLNDLAGTLTQARAVPCDVTDAADVARAHRDCGPVDGVIYCVGAYEPMTAQHWDTPAIRTMIAANFTGAVEVIGKALQEFIRRDKGHIVLIGSLAAYRGLPGSIGYGASKAALMHLAETLDADLRDTGVKVQIINPGFIRTRLTAKNDFDMPQIMSPEAAAEQVVRAMRHGRFATAFPRPFSWFFRVGRLLPRGVFFRIVG